MRAIWINAAERSISDVEYESLATLQKLVGGYIGCAPANIEEGDTLFVDDEGLFKPQAWFFMIEGGRAPLAGNGVIVGRETYDANDGYIITAAPTTTVLSLAGKVRFLDRKQVDAWAKGNASEPAVTYHSFGASGMQTEIVKRFGELYAAIPPVVGDKV